MPILILGAGVGMGGSSASTEITLTAPTFRLDTTTFYSVVRATESGTYYSRTAEGTFSSSAVTGMKRRARGKRLGDPMLRQQEMTWHLWRVRMGGVVPKSGDKLAGADGTVWLVLKVEVQSYGNRYRLTTKRLIA